MEAATHTLHAPHAPTPTVPRVEEDWGWVYEDPDLAPFRGTPKARPETPLTAFA